MNDLQTLLAFIQTQAPAGGIGNDGTLNYRDLDAYFNDKLTNGSNDPDDVRAMRDRALTVCGLAGANSVANSNLPQPGNEKRRAASATILAMSIIRDTNTTALTSHYNRLINMSLTPILSELKALLTAGDIVKSTKHSHLELKNFTSAGKQKTNFTHEAEYAYERAQGLLMSARQQFVLPTSAMSGLLAQAFTAFFGNPAAVVDTTTLPFLAGAAKPTWNPANQTKRAVVRKVLQKVCDAYISQDVRMYFGGRSIDTGTNAYVSGDTKPAKVHLGGTFFGKAKTGLNTKAGIVVHEFTHTFARTDDHAYGPTQCKALAVGTAAEQLKALTNADNYQYFVEAAFG